VFSTMINVKHYSLKTKKTETGGVKRGNYEACGTKVHYQLKPKGKGKNWRSLFLAQTQGNKKKQKKKKKPD